MTGLPASGPTGTLAYALSGMLTTTMSPASAASSGVPALAPARAAGTGGWGEQAPGAQELGDRTGVERGAGRAVRRVAVGVLADRAEAVLAEVRLEAVEQPVGTQTGRPARRGVRPDEPG